MSLPEPQVRRSQSAGERNGEWIGPTHSPFPTPSRFLKRTRHYHCGAAGFIAGGRHHIDLQCHFGAGLRQAEVGQELARSTRQIRGDGDGVILVISLSGIAAQLVSVAGPAFLPAK